MINGQIEKYQSTNSIYKLMKSGTHKASTHKNKINSSVFDLFSFPGFFPIFISIFHFLYILVMITSHPDPNSLLWYIYIFHPLLLFLFVLFSIALFTPLAKKKYIFEKSNIQFNFCLIELYCFIWLFLGTFGHFYLILNEHVLQLFETMGIKLRCIWFGK